MASTATHLPQPRRYGPVLSRRGWFLVVVALGMVAAGVWWHEAALVHMGMFVVGVVAAAWWLARVNLDGVGVERVAPARPAIPMLSIGAPDLTPYDALLTAEAS